MKTKSPISRAIFFLSLALVLALFTVSCQRDFLVTPKVPAPTVTFTFTRTVTPSPTSSLTPSSPTATLTPAGTSTLTATSTASPVPTGTPTITPTSNCGFVPVPDVACPDPFFTPTLVFTPCSSTPLAPGTIKLEACNSSTGNVAKLIWIQGFNLSLGSVVLLPDATISSLSDYVYVGYSGVTIGVWDGADFFGNPMEDGCYSLHMIQTSGSSVTDEVFLPVIVNRPIAKMMTTIHDGSNAIVRHLFHYLDDPGPSSMVSGISLSAGTFQPSYCMSGPANLLTITFSTGLDMVWDGRNDQGTILPAGEYTVRVCSSIDTAVANFSQAVTTAPLAESSAAVSIYVWPDPVTAGNTTTISASNCAGNLTLNARVYDSGNVLVRTVTGSPGTGQVVLSTTGLSPGNYHAEVDVYDQIGFTGTEMTTLTLN